MGGSEAREVTFELIFERRRGLVGDGKLGRVGLFQQECSRQRQHQWEISERLNGSPKVTQIRDGFAQDSTLSL